MATTFQFLIDTLAVFLSPTAILLLLLGTIFGMILGAIPGLGPVVGIALTIPLTFWLDPQLAFILLIAIMGGTNFGGSLASILLSTPGTVANAATLLDGYPMTRQGRGQEAIGASATASALGAIVGVIVLAASVPILLEVVLLFGPPEIFLLAMWGLSLVAVVARGSLRTGLISAMLGLLIAMHGFNPQTTTVRWSYGMTFMWSGFGLIPPVVGLFAVAEMMDLLSKGESIAKASNSDDDSSEASSTDSSPDGGYPTESPETESNPPEKGGRRRGILSVFRNWSIFLRSAIIGVVIGVIPGVGGSAANYVAYFQALKTSKNSENFGKGDVRGVIASEASNDAKDGGSLMPTLALGVPGSATTAILLGAFIMQGIQPGPFLLNEHLDIVVVIIGALLVSNILTSILGISLANYLTKVTQIDIQIVAPMVIGIAFFGTYAASQTVYDLFLLVLFGVLGYVMILTGISRIPLILGLVLGPIAEKQFWRSLAISGDDLTIFFESTISILLLVSLVLSLLQPVIVPLAKKRFRKLRELL